MMIAQYNNDDIICIGIYYQTTSKTCVCGTLLAKNPIYILISLAIVLDLMLRYEPETLIFFWQTVASDVDEHHDESTPFFSNYCGEIYYQT